MLLRSVGRSDLDAGQITAALAGDTVFLQVFWTTLRTAIVVTVGTSAARLSRSRWRWHACAAAAAAVVLIIVLLPFWTSVLVRSYAWMVLLGRHGLINEALIAAGLIDAPLRMLNTSLAVHIAMIHILLPYMILPIASVLRQIDPALPRAARVWARRRGACSAQVILPLSMPGVAAGVLLVFVLSLGFYITPALVGGPRDMTAVDADRAAGGPVELALCRLPVGDAAGGDAGDHGGVPAPARRARRAAFRLSATMTGWPHHG